MSRQQAFQRYTRIVRSDYIIILTHDLDANISIFEKKILSRVIFIKKKKNEKFSTFVFKIKKWHLKKVDLYLFINIRVYETHENKYGVYKYVFIDMD